MGSVLPAYGAQGLAGLANAGRTRAASAAPRSSTDNFHDLLDERSSVQHDDDHPGPASSRNKPKKDAKPPKADRPPANVTVVVPANAPADPPSKLLPSLPQLPDGDTPGEGNPASSDPLAALLPDSDSSANNSFFTANPADAESLSRLSLAADLSADQFKSAPDASGLKVDAKAARSDVGEMAFGLRLQVQNPVNTPSGKSGGGLQNGNAGSQRESIPVENTTAASPASNAFPTSFVVPESTPGSAAPAAAPASKTEAPHAPAPVAEVDRRPAPAPAAQEISLRVSTGNDQKVDVRLVSRAGEVHVSVHTPDEALARTMREDLGSLTGKLAQSGIGAEAITPSATNASVRSDHPANPDHHESSGGGQQNQQGGGSSDQQASRQGGREKRPAWFEEFNESLAQSPSNRSKQ